MLQQAPWKKKKKPKPPKTKKQHNHLILSFFHQF